MKTIYLAMAAVILSGCGKPSAEERRAAVNALAFDGKLIGYKESALKSAKAPGDIAQRSIEIQAMIESARSTARERGLNEEEIGKILAEGREDGIRTLESR